MKGRKGYITKEQLLSALMHFQETTDKKIEYNAWRKFQKFVIGLEDDDFAYYYEATGDVLFTVYRQNNESESIAGDKYLIDTLTSHGKSLESYNTCAANGTGLNCCTKPTYTFEVPIATKIANDEITSCRTGPLGVDYATTTSINWPQEYSTTAASIYSGTTTTVGETIRDIMDNLTKRIDDLEMKVKDTYVNDKKENKTVELMKNFEFGRVTNPAVRLSMYGIAVKNASNTWVSYDENTGDVIDVDAFNFDTGSFLYQLPVGVKNIKIGDVIVHNRKPCFVVGFAEDTGNPIVIDVIAGERKEILPTKNMFNFNFVTKIVNLAEGMFGNMKPNTDNPFGSMLPFLLMGDNTKMDDILPFLMMNGNGIDTGAVNPMFMYMMMKDTKDAKDVLPFLMMNYAHQGRTCGCDRDKND